MTAPAGRLLARRVGTLRGPGWAVPVLVVDPEAAAWGRLLALAGVGV